MQGLRHGGPRLAPARLLRQESDALLDEPTNHLSLAENPDVVAVVSHDRLLRERWQGGELELSGGRVLEPVA